jgi:polyisoprenoid-binding protein YceI
MSLTTPAVFDGIYEADPNHSSLEAGTTHMGVGSFRTRFDRVTARLTATEGGIELDGEVPVESIAIKEPPEFREHVVNGHDFFNASEFPAIAFTSDAITLNGDGTLELVGALTIKGVSREIRATGTYRPPIADPFGNTRAAIDLRTEIDRREFGISWQAELPSGGDALGWTVWIEANLEFVRAA